MKHIKRLFFMILLPAILLLAVVSAKAEPRVTAVIQTKDQQEIAVSLQAYNNKTCLFLPSFCDASHLVINGLNGEISNSKGSLRCDDDTPVDLKKIIPSIVPGKSYSVTFSDASKNKTTVQIMQSDHLPALFISLGQTGSGEKADRLWLEESKEHYAYHSTLCKVSSDGTKSEPLSIEHIKCRGNASYKAAIRKSYTIKLEDRYELVAEAGAAKKWILVANDVYDKLSYHDRTGIFNFASRWLYKEINGKYAIESSFVDLYIDGEYRGVYVLSEKPEIADTRINIAKGKMKYEDTASVTRVVGSCGLFLNGETVWEGYDVNHRDRMDTDCPQVNTIMYASSEQDKEDPAVNAGIRAYQYATESLADQPGGYLLEFDFRFGDVTAWFVTRRGATIAIQEPEYASREQVQEIAVYIQQFEDALFSQTGYNADGHHFTEYLDVDSVVRFSITEFFFANIDTFLSSTFLSVDYVDGKLQAITFGPVWDNDYCLINSTYLVSGKHAFKPKSKESGFPMIPWVEQLFTKTEYIGGMYKVWKDELLTAANRLADDVLPSMIDDVNASVNMTKLLTDSLEPQRAIDRAYKGIKNRIKTWKNYWNKNYLKGVEVTRKGNELTAVPDGPYTRIEWYIVNENDYSCECLSAGKSKTFTPARNGKYFVKVTGPNILYNNVGTSGALTEPKRAITSPIVEFQRQD